MQNDTSIVIDTKMMASFRIERADWEKFGLMVKGERLTATQVLTDYIEQCLSAGNSFYRANPASHETRTSTNEEFTAKQVRSLIDEAVSPLVTDILNLQSQLAELSIGVGATKNNSKSKAVMSRKSKIELIPTN
jgi:hypothetical protein